MNAEQFTTWLRGYMAAMHGRLGTPADVETIRAELAKVAASPVLKPFTGLDINEALKRVADEAEKRKNAEIPIWPHPSTTKWVGGCIVCGMDAGGRATGYVCTHPHCPTRVTCGTAPTEAAYVGPNTETAYVGPSTGLMGTVQGSSIK